MNTISRIEQLRDKLIQINNVNSYSCILAPKKKQDQYYRLLLELRKRKAFLLNQFRAENPNYVSHLKKATQNTLHLISNPLILTKQKEQYV